MIIDPLVSVIMPAYNAQKFISQGIASVINQTYCNWELVIVDDGSTDDTAAIIKQHQLSDSRIKVFFQENAGQGEAKNTAIKHSNGEYLAFLDADDLWMPEKLALTLKEFMPDKYDLVFTDCYVFEGHLPAVVATLPTMGVMDAVYNGRSALIPFLNSNKIPNLTVVVKKEKLLAAGNFMAIKVAEEYDMWLRLLANGNVFRSIPKPLSMYRLHGESITAKDRHAAFELIRIIKDFGRRHPEYAAETTEIVRDKIKYWLYRGTDNTNRNFRTAIKGIYNTPKSLLFYSLSWLMPFNTLRKFIIRLG